MGCIKLDILNQLPTKRSSQGFLGSPSNWESAHRSVASTYRFGFNGMELDNETKGIGSHYTTHFRQYDPRLGRWLGIDPKARILPSQSPYVSFDNNPVLKIDPKGDLAGDPKKNKEELKKKTDEAVKKAAEVQAEDDFNTFIDQLKTGSYTTEDEQLTKIILKNEVEIDIETEVLTQGQKFWRIVNLKEPDYNFYEIDDGKGSVFYLKHRISSSNKIRQVVFDGGFEGEAVFKIAFYDNKGENVASIHLNSTQFDNYYSTKYIPNYNKIMGKLIKNYDNTHGTNYYEKWNNQ